MAEIISRIVRVPTVSELIASWIRKNYNSEQALEIADKIEKGEWHNN